MGNFGDKIIKPMCIKNTLELRLTQSIGIIAAIIPKIKEVDGTLLEREKRFPSLNLRDNGHKYLFN